ncbi:MAG: protein translocase subunit SecF [Chromatiales bacterium]|nr:protein translocase subunit SecF [Chromatiales bacterium]
MRLLKPGQEIDFIGKRRIAVIGSLILIALSVFAFVTRGINLGIDFTGGTLVEVGYDRAIDLENVRAALGSADFRDVTVQHFGRSSDVLIRVAPREDISSEALSDKVFSGLKARHDGRVDLRRVEFVGPRVGKQLTEKGGLAVLYALIGILIYVAVRFEYRFAIGAVVALIHDVTITMGVFSLFQIEFNLNELAAVLAVIGYSLNDTIVVYDRIRENFRRHRKGTPETITNSSLNETLSRTLMTSLTTMLVLVALFLLGGEIIHGFSLALLVGIFVGTYSSIYVASVAALALGISKSDLMPVQKEGADTPKIG